MKSKLAIIIDSIFISIISFIVILFWIQKLTKNAIFSLIFSIIVSILLFFVIFKKFIINNKTKITDKNQKEYFENCLKFLTYSSENNRINFLNKLLNSTNLSDKIFKIKNNIIYINLQSETTDSDFFYALSYYHKENINQKNLFFICKSQTKSFDNVISNSEFKDNIFDANILYNIMKEKNCYPIPESQNKKENFFNKTKNQIKQISKTHFKKLFFTGLSLLTLSLFVPYYHLYLIFGTIMLCLSIYSLFIKNENNSKNDNLESVIIKKQE